MPRDSGVIRFKKEKCIYMYRVSVSFPAECKRIDSSRSFGEYYIQMYLYLHLLFALFTYGAC